MGRQEEVGRQEPLSENLKYALGVAYLALRISAGDSFRSMVCGGFGLYAAAIAHMIFQLDGTGALQCGATVATAVGLAVVLAPGVADLLALAALGGFATKPAAASFDGDALRQVRRSTRAAEQKTKTKNPFEKLKRKVTGAVDDFLTGLADRAADVRFFDLSICVLAVVTPPGSDESCYVVGAFWRWFNVSALAIHVDRRLRDFGSAHGAGGAERPRTMLVRVPANTAAGATLRVTDPRGNVVKFAVPPGAAGTVLQLRY